jgi:hypothetical protein
MLYRIDSLTFERHLFPHQFIASLDCFLESVVVHILSPNDKPFEYGVSFLQRGLLILELKHFVVM